MGTLRLLLALSVLGAHSLTTFGWRGVGGTAAVEIFYMISGFLITVVLHAKYRGPGHLLLFYSNRILRIWVPYILVAGLTLLAMKVICPLLGGYVLGGSAFFSRTSLHDFDWVTLTASLVTNVFLIGQDIGMLFAYDPARGGLYFTPQFGREAHPFYQFYIMEQSWTLGVELAFYLVAPFLVLRRWYVLAALLAASLAARFATYAAGFDFDPWTYRFFPFELAFFLAGALAAKFYLAREARRPVLGWPEKTLALAAVGLVLAWNILPEWLRPQSLLFILVAAALPFLFKWTQDWPIDRFVGALSYPVYLVHVPVTDVFRSLMHAEISGPLLYAMSPLSIALAILLAKFVEAPLDRLRQRRAHRGLASREPGPAYAET